MLRIHPPSMVLQKFFDSPKNSACNFEAYIWLVPKNIGGFHLIVVDWYREICHNGPLFNTVPFLECIFSRKLETQNWVFPTTSSYSYGRTSARRARVPAHNCMNEWLGEPVLGFQLPGRGILKNFINKVIIWNTLIVRTAKQKTTDDFTCRFIFLIGKTKNLQMKKFVFLIRKTKNYRWQPPVDFLFLFVNNLSFISLCFINEITENDFFLVTQSLQSWKKAIYLLLLWKNILSNFINKAQGDKKHVIYK